MSLIIILRETFNDYNSPSYHIMKDEGIVWSNMKVLVNITMEVNSYIENLPHGAVLASSFGLDSCQGTKYYYSELSRQQKQNAQNPQKPCNGGGGGEEGDNNGNSSNSTGYPEGMGGFKGIDTHDTWKSFKDLPEATKQLIANNINTIVKATADQVERGRGTIPANLQEIIEKLREKKPEIFNWKAYFRRMLGSIYDVNIRSTRRKESKRFEGAAGVQHKKKVSILVAVDTSGSVSTKELQDFFNEIEYIYKAGARVTILECDTQINKVVEYDGKMIPDIIGRGGTSFDPPVEYYIKHKKEYASLIYFTDGEAPLPTKHPAGMVWVITSNGSSQDFPGKTIYIPKDYGR